MAPHLDRWHERWSEKGLRVVQVEDGAATSLEELKAWALDRGVAHAILYDGGATLTTRYGVEAFPTGVLVDRVGRVVWHGYPSADPEGVERAIARALERK
jgi:hypothetical protein